MGSFAPLSLLITAIVSICLVVGYALAVWSVDSRSTRSRKAPPSPPPTNDFETRCAKIEADQVELFSILEKLTTSMRRLSSRAGMRDLRERQADEPPPLGTPKAQLRKHYGLEGKSHIEVARIVSNNPKD